MREAVSPRVTVAVVAGLIILVGAIGYFAVIRPGKQGAQPTQDEMMRHMQQAHQYMQQSAQYERAARAKGRAARQEGTGANRDSGG